MAYFFAVFDRNWLAELIGFQLPFGCFCHRVCAQFFYASTRSYDIWIVEVIVGETLFLRYFRFKFSNALVCFSVQIQWLSFFNTCLSISVRAQLFSMYFDKCCNSPRNYFSASFVIWFVELFYRQKPIFNVLIPFWSFFCPIHSIFLNSLAV